MIRKWYPDTFRGTASGIVSLGGRVGGTFTPLVIYLLMEHFGWRSVMAGVGIFGIAFGLLFLLAFRNRPREHAWCSPDEVLLIEGPDAAAAAESPPAHVPWRRLLTHPSLWISSFLQVGVNFCWVFILTNLNRFLADYFGVPGKERAWMVFTVMAFNLPALILGGRLTDRLTAHYGRRWGRALPLSVPRFASALCVAAIAVLLASARAEDINPWTVILLLGGTAFFTDLALPAIWAFNIDVGKRHVGLVLGWGNMWGNLGAFFTPHAVNYIAENVDWPWVFWIFTLVFVGIGVAGLFLRADDPLEAEVPVPPPAVDAAYARVSPQ